VGQNLKVVAVMERIKTLRGVVPKHIQVDNGSEFISKALDKWAYDNQVTLHFSRPGKPTDNPFFESFNGSFRDERLNVNWFLSLKDAKQKFSRLRSSPMASDHIVPSLASPMKLLRRQATYRSSRLLRTTCFSFRSPIRLFPSGTSACVCDPEVAFS
jgi:putative transposase